MKCFIRMAANMYSEEKSTAPPAHSRTNWGGSQMRMTAYRHSTRGIFGMLSIARIH